MGQIQQQMQQTEQEYANLETLRDKIEDERNSAYKDIEKLHVLIEKMEQAIEKEKISANEQVLLREQKERELS